MGRHVLWAVLAGVLLAGCNLLSQDEVLPECTGNETLSRPHLLYIDIDDHSLAGLWTAAAPHLQGLIEGGTLAYSRVALPSRSNANNYSLLTGQYPDGHAVPGNSWLSRSDDFHHPVDILGIRLGSYVLYDQNPLLVRSDGIYELARRAGLRSFYVGQLPPFEAGADVVHLASIGMPVEGHTLSRASALAAMIGVLHYPPSVVKRYHFNGPGYPGETSVHFVMRDAAEYVRSTCAERPLPDVMFVWNLLDFADSTTLSDNQKSIADYDAGLGELLYALHERGKLDDTNIVLTLDQGRVDVFNQAVLGTRGASGNEPADGQLGLLVESQGAALGISPTDYALINDEGAAYVYARVPGAGTPAGQPRQQAVTGALLSLIQSGQLSGVDVSRTMTFDGALGTRRFVDYHLTCPDQADIIVYAQEDWTLNQVEGESGTPGPLGGGRAYSRHGGLALDEVYVPVIMNGPAFKRGVLLPHAMSHPDVAATAVRTLQVGDLKWAQGAPALAAFADDPGETLPQPQAPWTSRDVMLRAAGLDGALGLAGTPAPSAVLIDVAGLYHDELFTDPATAAAAAPLRDLARQGTVFQRFWTRSRDWPVTEYELLAGGLPDSANWVSFAEADPAQVVPPGQGLLKIPPPPGFVADQAAYARWRQAEVFTRAGMFEAARALGLATALVGQTDFHGLHVSDSVLDLHQAAEAAALPDLVRGFLAAHPGAFVVVALGGPRAGDRRSPAALDELSALASTATAIAQAAAGALIAITSRGATVVDDGMADLYGAESSRHVPLILLGPNVRAGVITSEPGGPSDVPATLLYGLGAPTRTDSLDGTMPVAENGTPVFRPGAARVLVRAFHM